MMMVVHREEQSFIACLASFKQVIYGLINYKREDAPIWVVVVLLLLLLRQMLVNGTQKANCLRYWKERVMEKWCTKWTFHQYVSLQHNASTCQHFIGNLRWGCFWGRTRTPLIIIIIILILNMSSISDRQVLVAGWQQFPKREHIIEALWGTASTKQAGSRQIINLTYTLTYASVCVYMKRQSCQIHQHFYAEIKHTGEMQVKERRKRLGPIKKWSIIAGNSNGRLQAQSAGLLMRTIHRLAWPNW